MSPQGENDNVLRERKGVHEKDAGVHSSESRRQRSLSSSEQLATSLWSLWLREKKRFLHLSFLEDQFWEFDEQIAGQVHRATLRSPMARATCSFLSITGDEALWFIFPVVIASVLAMVEGGPFSMSCHQISCDMEFFLDLFGGMSVCAVIEQLLKCFFQRPRPSCRKYENKYCCVWGEWYSFPSGHSMRALYAFNWLFYSTHGKAVLELPEYLEPCFLVWALGVGYARVAAGRHHPIDVIVGDFVGLVLGRVVENQLSPNDRALVKTLCGVCVALQVWFLLLGPALSDLLRDFLSGKASTIFFLTTLAGVSYFTFYTGALLSILSIFMEEKCEIGHFSRRMDLECNRWTLSST